MSDIIDRYLIPDLRRIVQSYYQNIIIASSNDGKIASVYDCDNKNKCVKFNVSGDARKYDSDVPGILLFPALNRFYYCQFSSPSRHIITGTISEFHGEDKYDFSKKKFAYTTTESMRTMYHILESKSFCPSTLEYGEFEGLIHKSADGNYNFRDKITETTIFHYNVQMIGKLMNQYKYRRIIDENYYVSERVYDVQRNLKPLFRFTRHFVPFCFRNNEIIGVYAPERVPLYPHSFKTDIIVAVTPKTRSQRIIYKSNSKNLDVNPYVYDTPRVNVGPNGTVIMFKNKAIILFNTAGEIGIRDMNETIIDMCVM